MLLKATNKAQKSWRFVGVALRRLNTSSTCFETIQMTHNYQLSGITCGSCAQKIRTALEAVEGVTEVQVDVATQVAAVTMTTHIPSETLATAVEAAGKYSLVGEVHDQAKTADSTPAAQDHLTEEPHSFKPLILVLGYILLATVMAEVALGEFDGMRAMRHYMGGFFLAFSFFKLLDLKGFAYSYVSYDVVTKQWMTWGFIYPFVELALGLAYLGNVLMTVTLWTTVVVMGVSSIGVIQAVANKRQIQCACLGTGFNLPMTTVTIIEDVGMLAMAVGKLVWG